MSAITFGFINLLGLILILFFALRKKVALFLINRSSTMSRDIVDAEAKRETANNSLLKYQKHLEEFSSEKDFLMESAEREGARVQENFLDQAVGEEEKLKLSADKTFAAEQSRAVEQLYISSVTTLLENTRQRLSSQLKEAEHDQLIETSVKNLETLAHELRT